MPSRASLQSSTLALETFIEGAVVFSYMGKEKTFSALIYAGVVGGVALLFATGIISFFTTNITILGVGAGLGVLTVIGTVIYAMSVAHKAVLG